MIKITNMKLPVESGGIVTPEMVAAHLDVPADQVKNVTILRRSVDARKKRAVTYVCTVSAEVGGEAEILRAGLPGVTAYTPPAPYAAPACPRPPRRPVVIVGSGPAGLFAALGLTDAGVPCILLERGQPVERRVADIRAFWRDGALNPQSNVQFGEGGAGTFSDGKLTTGVNDPRIPHIFREFVRFGAPEEILYTNRPHIGTDRLRVTVKNIRAHLAARGCEFRFGTQMTDLVTENGRLTGVETAGPEGVSRIETEALILAPGNSARDTFEMLLRRGVPLSAKAFSVGVRIEHLQRAVDAAQYGEAATLGTLPAADYKLAVHLPSGRSVYTFCVCPGGSVVAAASEAGGIVTNGMSEYARDGENCNGGLLVSVTPEDFGDDPMAGIALQRRLEQGAFQAGGGDYRAPAQLVGDFLARRASTGPRSVVPTYRPGVRYGNLWDTLPEFVCAAICEALPEMGRRIRGFAAADAVLTAVETRSSCPVRIDRAEYESTGLSGLFPCGEGAGYAGGITSSGVDGLRCAEAVIARLNTGAAR